jgi:hypothetical protein
MRSNILGAQFRILYRQVKHFFCVALWATIVKWIAKIMKDERIANGGQSMKPQIEWLEVFQCITQQLSEGFCSGFITGTAGAFGIYSEIGHWQ